MARGHVFLRRMPGAPEPLGRATGLTRFRTPYPGRGCDWPQQVGAGGDRVGFFCSPRCPASSDTPSLPAVEEAWGPGTLEVILAHPCPLPAPAPPWVLPPEGSPVQGKPTHCLLSQYELRVKPRVQLALQTSSEALLCPPPKPSQHLFMGRDHRPSVASEGPLHVTMREIP